MSGMPEEQASNPVSGAVADDAVESVAEERSSGKQYQQGTTGINSHHVDDKMHEYQQHVLHTSVVAVESWTTERKRLAGTRVMPQFHDRLRELSKAEGDLDTEEAARHAHLYGRFFLATFVVCVACFGFPLRSACGLKVELSYSFLDEQWRFFVFCFPGVLLMMASIPGFGLTLALNLPREEEEADSVLVSEWRRQARHNHLDARALGDGAWVKVAPSLAVALPSTVICILATIYLAETWFGFPVPYTVLVAGFPAYFTLFPLYVPVCCAVAVLLLVLSVAGTTAAAAVTDTGVDLPATLMTGRAFTCGGAG
jgi:hypothetical protein